MGSKLARVLVAMHLIPTTEQQNGMSKPMKDRAEIVYYIFLLIYQIKKTIHVWKSTSHIAHPMRNGGFSTWPGRSLHPKPEAGVADRGNTTAKGLVAWIGYIYIPVSQMTFKMECLLK